MIVCLCKAVSDREIRQAIGEGHTSLKAIAQRCGAGTGRNCGGCHSSLKALAVQHGPQPAPTNSDAEQAAPCCFELASLATTG